MGFSLQSQTVYLDIFLNKIIIFLRGLLFPVIEFFLHSYYLYHFIWVFVLSQFEVFWSGKHASFIYILLGFYYRHSTPRSSCYIISHGPRYQIPSYFTNCKGPWFLLVQNPNLGREKKMREIEMNMPLLLSSHVVIYSIKNPNSYDEPNICLLHQ